MSKSKQQVFSIAQKYEKVVEVLNGVENKSEFICQAIMEKIENNKEAVKETASATIDKVELREEIMAVLNEMMQKDVFIVKGGLDNLTPTIGSSRILIPAGVLDSNEALDVKDEVSAVDKETKDMMKDVIGDW